jgi:predicted N-acetyltransferase YhbS
VGQPALGLICSLPQATIACVRFSRVRFGVEGVKIAAAVAALAGKLLSRSKSLASQIADEVLPSFFDHRQD